MTSVSKSPVSIVRTSAAVYVITQQDIRRSGATNLPEAIRLCSGRGGGADRRQMKWSVGIRGFDSRLSRAVLVLIDGLERLPIPFSTACIGKSQDTLMEDIDRIEVIRGPGGTIWGPDAVNGVINIITKDSRDTHGTLVSAGGGNVSQGFTWTLVTVAGTGSNFSYRVYGKGSTSAPEYHFDNAQFDDQRRTQGGFRLDWDATGRDTVTVQGDAYDGVAGESVEGDIPDRALQPDCGQERNLLSGANVLARWEACSVRRRIRYPDSAVLRPRQPGAGKSGGTPRHLRFRPGPPPEFRQAERFYLGIRRAHQPG